VVFQLQQRLRISWQVILELHIDDGADDLCDFADCICHVVSTDFVLQRFRARK